MDGSCEYFEQAVVDSRHVVLQLGGSARCCQLLAVKTDLFMKQIHAGVPQTLKLEKWGDL